LCIYKKERRQKKAEKSKGAESNDKSDELTNAAIPIPAPRRYVLVLLVFAVA